MLPNKKRQDILADMSGINDPKGGIQLFNLLAEAGATSWNRISVSKVYLSQTSLGYSQGSSSIPLFSSTC